MFVLQQSRYYFTKTVLKTKSNATSKMKEVDIDES